MTIGSAGADVHTLLVPRTDPSGVMGATGYVLYAWNTGASAESFNATANQATDYDEYDTQFINSPGAPQPTPPPADDGSWIRVSINQSYAANATFYGSNSSPNYALYLAPGAIRMISIINSAADPSPSPTAVAVVTPAPTSTPAPAVFPTAFPTAYQYAVNSLLAPAIYPGSIYTPYPFQSAPTLSAGVLSGTLSFFYLRADGTYVFVAYNNTAGGTANLTCAGSAVGCFLNQSYIISPTQSPTPSGYGSFVNVTGNPAVQYYVLPTPAPNGFITTIAAGLPTADPAPTVSPYPAATSVATPYYLSRVGGPFPPPSKVLNFLQNPMLGQVPDGATLDANDAMWITNSGVQGGPDPFIVGGTIAGDQSNGGYAINYVDNSTSDSTPYKLDCGSYAAYCAPLQGLPIWMANDPQRQDGATDYHIVNENFQGDGIGPYEDECWISTVPLRYQGASQACHAYARLYMNSDGTNGQVTASGVTPTIGLVKPWDWTDTTTKTFPYALYVSTKCTSAGHLYPSNASDAGAGSSCPGINPPSGARFIYRTSGGTDTKAVTLAHIASCGLDAYSAKFWNTLAVYGAEINDTNHFTGGFSVYFESDRDIDKYGYSNPYAAIASTLGASLNVGTGTYTFSMSRGTSNCISLSDIHFLAPTTVYQAGTPYP